MQIDRFQANGWFVIRRRKIIHNLQIQAKLCFRFHLNISRKVIRGNPIVQQVVEKYILSLCFPTKLMRLLKIPELSKAQAWKSPNVDVKNSMWSTIGSDNINYCPTQSFLWTNVLAFKTNDPESEAVAISLSMFKMGELMVPAWTHYKTPKKLPKQGCHICSALEFFPW